jgi:hypothetical protein
MSSHHRRRILLLPSLLRLISAASIDTAAAITTTTTTTIIIIIDKQARKEARKQRKAVEDRTLTRLLLLPIFASWGTLMNDHASSSMSKKQDSRLPHRIGGSSYPVSFIGHYIKNECPFGGLLLGTLLGTRTHLSM